MHDTQTIQTLLIAIAAAALVLQTIFLIALVVTAGKAIRTIQRELEEYRAVVIPVFELIKPVFETTREVVGKIAPRVDEITAQMNTITKSLSEQTVEIRSATNEIIDRTRHQANRLDGIITAVLDKVEHAGVVVADTVAKPMKQISGLIASVKAAVEVLCQPAHPGPRPRVVSTRFADGEDRPESRPAGTTSQYHS